MSKNDDQEQGSKFKTLENDAFGASKTKELSIGDLVEWTSWEYNLSEEYYFTKQGLLIDIIKDRRLSGWIYLGKIAPFGEEKEILIPLISVRKMRKTN